MNASLHLNTFLGSCPRAGRADGCRKRLRIMAIAAPEIEREMQTPSTAPDVPKGLNRFSSKVTQPKSQGASQAMLYATGLTEDDMDKPQVLYLSIAVLLVLNTALVAQSRASVPSSRAHLPSPSTGRI
jgi:hypothetical protein